jgi:hypothetical protein
MYPEIGYKSRSCNLLINVFHSGCYYPEVRWHFITALADVFTYLPQQFTVSVV